MGVVKLVVDNGPLAEPLKPMTYEQEQAQTLKKIDELDVAFKTFTWRLVELTVAAIVLWCWLGYLAAGIK